jgi:hypothetical protein
MCKWRETLPQDTCVVELYEYGIKEYGSCTNMAELYVITERVHLLCEIGVVSKAEALLIIRDAACGLRTLFDKFGFFNPKTNLIGINAEGRARVWVNQNFAKVEPEKDVVKIESSEIGIVNNLIRIMEAKTVPKDTLRIDYPWHLNLSSAVNYVNKVFAEFNGFEVDRVYIDRAEFAKR